MAKGRPPAWQIFGELEPRAWTQPVEVASRGRLSLPSPVRARLGWLESWDQGLLATVDPQGSAELTSWAAYGDATVAAVNERMQQVPTAQRGNFALAAMDRYLRVTTEGSGRLALPGPLQWMLDPSNSSVVRVVVLNDRLWVWNEEAWQNRRAERLALLTGG